MVIIDTSTKQIIGSSRFKPITDINTALEIGYTFLTRDYWGGSTNKAVKTLMINHAFKFFEDVVLYIDKDNIRSQKAAEKIGAKRQSEDSPFVKLRSNNRDLAYRINKDEWQNPIE